jgi:putative transposase
MPAAVTLTLALPSELGDPAPLLDEVRAQVAATEAAVAAERMRTGARVLGRRTILRQSWRACPASLEPRRNLRPRTAARSQWARLEALGRNREFLAVYREARARWLSGAEASFPVGTYWLRRFAHGPLAG